MMNFTGTVISLLCGLIPLNDLSTPNPERTKSLLTPHSITADLIRPEPADLMQTQYAGQGFLFVNNVYQPGSTRLEYTSTTFRLTNTSDTFLAYHDGTFDDGLNVRDVASDANFGLVSPSKVFEFNPRQIREIQTTLKNGGLVFLNEDEAPATYPLTNFGDCIVEALNQSPGTERETLLTEAWKQLTPPPAQTVKWLKTVRPVGEFSDALKSSWEKIESVENQNLAASQAIRRFDNWTYPITIVAMLIFVFSMGSLLSAKPQELVAVAHSSSEITVSRFLWLIAGMSVIDLVWTLLAYQANAISEVNPIGGVLLNDANRTAVFKLLATGLAIGILYRARQHQVARKATWWVCLTLALLMARWILVSGVSA